MNFSITRDENDKSIFPSFISIMQFLKLRFIR
jgi:hypothetical protein